MNTPQKPKTASIHLHLEAPPPPGERRRPHSDPHEIHDFGKDGTSTLTYIMDKTGIYKNRTIAVLRNNRFMITLIIVLCATVYMLSRTIPSGITGFISRNDVKKESLLHLENFRKSDTPLAPLVRCMLKNDPFHLYVENKPELKAEFFKTWAQVPASIIPVTFCKANDARCPFTLPHATMGAQNNVIPLKFVGGTEHEVPDPYAVIFHSSCTPSKYQVQVRGINHVMVVPGFEQEALGVGYYFYILGVQFLKHWGFIFIILIIFLGANKRPYSKRIEEHRHWSIK